MASVLESIHVYWANVFLLPQTVIHDINSLLKGFLWSQGEKADGKAKIAWKNVCKPKAKGGLGLKDLSVWNKAMLTKYIWYIADGKDTLWVKWINTYKLKGRSIWVINEEANDSWGWRNMLRLRQEIRVRLVKVLGDGDNTSVWFDSWSTFGAINNYITYRDLYKERFKMGMTVKEFVEVSNGKWPREWVTKLPVHEVNHNIVLASNQLDRLMWRSNDGILRKFSVKQAYKDLSNSGNDVTWFKLVWFSQNIPKSAFILWLAIQCRLNTQDKIRKRGSYDMMVSVLCHEETDSHEHLFFKCKFSNGLWKKVLEKMQGLKWVNLEWQDLIVKLVSVYNGNSINSVVRRLCLATCVYMVWQERNSRLFRDERRSEEVLFHSICDIVRNRLRGLKVKKSKAIRKVEEIWDVQFEVTSVEV